MAKKRVIVRVVGKTCTTLVTPVACSTLRKVASGEAAQI